MDRERERAGGMLMARQATDTAQHSVRSKDNPSNCVVSLTHNMDTTNLRISRAYVNIIGPQWLKESNRSRTQPVPDNKM